jgi:maleamate amidohydrolase
MMSDIYVQRGYGSRTVGFGVKPAVVVVDFQRGFTEPAFPMGGAPMVDAAVNNTVPLIVAAKRAGLPVIACVIGYDTPRAAPLWKAEGVFDLLVGSNLVELDPRIAAAGPDVVLMKSAPSIFFGTPAGAILTKERVDTVIVTGCITSGCVRASVIDAFSLGFRVMVPRDCVGDHDADAHEQNLKDIERRYADVIDSETAVAAIEGLRGRNAIAEPIGVSSASAL